MTLLSDLPLMGKKSQFEIISNGKNYKVNLLGTDRHTKVSMVTLLFDLPSKVKIKSYFNWPFFIKSFRIEDEGHVKCQSSSILSSW